MDLPAGSAMPSHCSAAKATEHLKRTETKRQINSHTNEKIAKENRATVQKKAEEGGKRESEIEEEME